MIVNLTYEDVFKILYFIILMNNKEYLTLFLLFVLGYLLAKQTYEPFQTGGDLPFGQLVRNFVEHGNVPLFYR
tara:strand:+ start:2558 stop:2776 length:219 start_codon:yes stop_codon:yes gene_type:complete